MRRSGAVALLLLVGGCGGAADNKIPADLLAALEKAEEFELLSLDPKEPDEKPKDGFHGWRVLGKTAVTDAETRKKLVAAFKKGATDSDGTVAACFIPRHGIRVTREKKTVDFVVCFQCLQVKAYAGDAAAGGFLTTAGPQKAFDAVLTDAKVPLAGKP
jgi:hypothetical protein